MFVEAIEDILRDACTPETVRELTANPRDGSLWDTIANAGFLDLMLPVERDGAGLTLAEMEELVELFGYYAAPLPFAQTIAARALVGPNLALPSGMIALAPVVQERPEGGWSCSHLLYGAAADYVLTRQDDHLLLLSSTTAQRSSPNLPGDLSVSLQWPAAAGTALSGDANTLAPMAAALTAAHMAGSMRRVMEMTLEYCNTRVQFGRTLGKFQSIQHQLSVMAEHTLATSMAVTAAFHSDSAIPARIPAAMAKARAGEAAVIIANTAHALHGAIGVTEEYDLQLHTRLLHEGRLAYGSEKYWHRLVGEDFLAQTTTATQYVRSF